MTRRRRAFPYGVKPPLEISENADKLLNEYWDITKSLEVKTFLVYGTCLGFVRDGGYIENDNDLDIGILGEIGKLEVKLIENGFIKKRSWPPANYHFVKYDVLLDIWTDFPESHRKYFQSFDKIMYKGRAYDVPHPIEEYLKTKYGDWRIRELRVWS